METSNEPLSKTEFWMRIAGWSFALWALMIPVGILMVRGAFDSATKANIDVAVEISSFSRRFDAYALNMERRVTIIEERQLQYTKHLADSEQNGGRK